MTSVSLVVPLRYLSEISTVAAAHPKCLAFRSMLLRVNLWSVEICDFFTYIWLQWIITSIQSVESSAEAVRRIFFTLSSLPCSPVLDDISQDCGWMLSWELSDRIVQSIRKDRSTTVQQNR